MRVSTVNNPSGEGPSVVVAATGGSGTRVIARLVRRLGYFIGTNLNESEDGMDFPDFYDRWINRYILRDKGPLCAEEEALMQSDFLATVERHRAPIPDQSMPWGWKEPRSIYLLPFLNEKCAAMKFIHVVRDGRDMAFSVNQNQLRKHGPSMLGPAISDFPSPVASAMLWAAVNNGAADYGESKMPGRYLRVIYERLCRQPAEVIDEIVAFLQVERYEIGPLTEEVSPPQTIGRWRTSADSQLLEEIHLKAGPALARFGYL